MVGYKEKIIAFLLAVACGSAALLVCPAQSTAAKSETPSSYSSRSLSGNDANLFEGRADGVGTKELFFKMMLSVLLVIVLGVAAIYISKKFLPRITNLPHKKIHVVETVHLGSRKVVHLLKIGDQQLLIGSTNESITKLADVTDALPDSSSQETDNMRI